MYLRSILASAGILVATGALAQSYPVKPLRLVVPFVAGGGTDIVARTVAAKVSESLGHQIIIDNRVGAGGIIGTEQVAKAAPDGYTLLMGSNGPLAIVPAYTPKLGYDPLRDLAPVALVTVMPFLLVVHPALPVRSVKELVALAKSKPGQLNFASPGNGSTNHLAGELLKVLAGIQIVHVPYKGASPAATDLMSGQVQLMSGDLSTLMPFVKVGKVRALAVTGAARSSLMPQMPTVAESGVPGYDASGWFGILAPAGVPKDVVGRLNADINKALALPDVRERLAVLGGDVTAGTPEQFGAHLKREFDKWAKVIKAIGLKPEAGS